MDDSLKPKPREIARLVLDGLRRPRGAASRAARLGLSPELLAELTERFVDAGARAVIEADRSPRWLQFGVELATSRRARSERDEARFGEELRRAVLRWRARGLVGRFFFMGKPPGMRLRFETSPTTPRAVTERTVLAWLERRPSVARIERGLYLAESYQFGGEAGSDVAHDYHASDSLLALEATYREARGTASASPEVLSLLVVSDLARRMTDDAWEAWDLWKRMEITGRLRPVGREAARAMIEMVQPFVHRPEAVLPRLALADRRLVTTAYEANARAAGAMRELARRGKLLFHLREIIPFWIVFHWNRWGIVNQTALAVGIEGALNPRTRP